MISPRSLTVCLLILISLVHWVDSDQVQENLKNIDELSPLKVYEYFTKTLIEKCYYCDPEIPSPFMTHAYCKNCLTKVFNEQIALDNFCYTGVNDVNICTAMTPSIRLACHDTTLALIKNLSTVTPPSVKAKRELACAGAPNGSIDAGEECDLGVTGCIDCVIEYGYTCNQGAGTCSTTCGDGKHVSLTEQCDDGDLADNDGCDHNCLIEHGWTCTSALYVPSSCTPDCGDGEKLGSETCDDGNTENNDGCSSLCQLQLQFGRFTCVENLGTIPNTKCKDNCGDGYNVNKDMNSNYKAGFTDYCDDGNTDSGDGCSSTCSTESRYECIGGNLVKADFCRDKCGDGMKFTDIKTSTGLATIECDDGNLEDGDGCNYNCEVEEDYFCADGNSTSPDRCWYTLRYRPSVKNLNKRSDSYIGMRFNDTLEVTSLSGDKADMTLRNEIDDTDIEFEGTLNFASETLIIADIKPKEVLLGGRRSVLTIDFNGNVKINDLLISLNDPYEIEMVENPTNQSLGYALGITFHVLFVILFLGLCVIIIADLENLCLLTILTAMQRLYAVFLLNTRLAPFLATFGVQLGVVNFKTVYFEWLFLYQINLDNIALSKHDYNSLGWFGYATKQIVYNSAGTLSFILMVFFVYLSYLTLFLILKVFKSKGKMMDVMTKLWYFWLQIFIIIQQLVLNDLTLSVVINMSDLKFTNSTTSYSSAICLLCALILFSLTLIPMGLISNNKVKYLFSDHVLARAGAYYANMRLIENSQFYNYYIVYNMLYSLFYSIILIAFESLPYVQISAMIILNFVYLVISFMRPYNTRILNIVNVINHTITFTCTLLASATIAIDSYADYPWYGTFVSMIFMALVFAMAALNFSILYMRLLPAFIRGVKGGCKFRSLQHFEKEDREIDAPSVVLPDGHNLGRINYDDQGMRPHHGKVNITEEQKSVTNVTRFNSSMSATNVMDKTNDGMSSHIKFETEEVKTKSTAPKDRRGIYDDHAL